MSQYFWFDVTNRNEMLILHLGCMLDLGLNKHYYVLKVRKVLWCGLKIGFSLGWFMIIYWLLFNFLTFTAALLLFQ